jgi:multidrug efflux system membrane fusion protein
MDWTRFRVSPRLLWLGAGALLIGAVALVRWGATAQEGAGLAPPAPSVTVARPLAETAPRFDEFTGRFVAVQRVEVRPRVSGAVEKIHFADGQLVKAGDPLFTIDPRPYQIAVDSARAEVARAQAQTTMLAKDATRGESLVGGGVITRRDFDQRRGGSDSARAQLQGAEAALRNAELNLEWTQVRAPIAGRVSDRRIDVGNLVQAGVTLLTTIVALDPIRFEFEVSESDFLHYARGGVGHEQKGQTVAFVRLADETEWKHKGSIDFLDNQLNTHSGTIRARATLPNKDLFLTPGGFGRVRVNGGDVAALLIPDAAVASDQTSKVVMVVGAEDRVVAKPVTLGPLHKGLRIVLTGLDANDRVIIAGLANPMVHAGAVVTPAEGVIAPLGN